MTAERDSDATVKLPKPQLERIEEELEEVDPEKTIVREDWESVVIRRVAPHVAAVQSEMAEDSGGESRYGWESEGLRRLAAGLRKVGE